MERWKIENYRTSGKFHTEVLESHFGTMNIQVLRDDDTLREVLLTDKHDIARTYALTVKSGEWRKVPEIIKVNEAIQNGQAIGRAFKEAGFGIEKKILDVSIITLPCWLQNAFVHESEVAKARTVEFMVAKNGKTYSYGIITEIYSPAFRKPEINKTDKEQICTSSALDIEIIKTRVRSVIYEIIPLQAVC